MFVTIFFELFELKNDKDRGNKKKKEKKQRNGEKIKETEWW